MSAKALRRTRPRGELRRAEILDAATQVFLESGYAGATIDLVVARAGASKATIYSFFGGKEGLFAALVEARCERFLSAFPNVDLADVDVPVALAQIGRWYMDAAMDPDNVALYRLILAEGVRFPELARTLHRSGTDRVSTHLAGILESWRKRGLVGVDDPELTAIQFLDAVRGDLQLRAVAGLPPDDLAAAVERSVQNAVRIFWSGIGRHDGGSRTPGPRAPAGRPRSPRRHVGAR